MTDLTEAILCLSTPVADFTYVPQTQILYDVIKGEDPFEVSDVKKIIENEMQLVNGEIHAQIISFETGFISPSREARQYSAHVLSEINRVSLAFVVNHLPVRLVLNSFIIFNKPSIPTKMFSNIEAAERWSLEMLESYKKRQR